MNSVGYKQRSQQVRPIGMPKTLKPECYVFIVSKKFTIHYNDIGFRTFCTTSNKSSSTENRPIILIELYLLLMKNKFWTTLFEWESKHSCRCCHSVFTAFYFSWTFTGKGFRKAPYHVAKQIKICLGNLVWGFIVFDTLHRLKRDKVLSNLQTVKVIIRLFE